MTDGTGNLPPESTELQHHRPLGYPTEELPTYRKVEPHPQPEDTRPLRASAQRTEALHSTGELPVHGAPSTAVTQEPPHGPHVPGVVRGLVVLVLSAFVIIWRLVDDPDWALVGIGMGIAAGAVLLLAAGVSLIVRRTRAERDFDRMLTRS